MNGTFLSALAALLLAGCASSRPGVVEQETFDAQATYTRSFDATPAQTCEAARRALLSQGYTLAAASAEQVQARKHFQPKGDAHVEIEIRVVCAADTAGATGGRGSTAFVNALQDRYALKKSNNSASVGVGALGSLSLPFASGDDALVKVASETVAGARFYDRFFALVGRYLPTAPPEVVPGNVNSLPDPAQ